MKIYKVILFIILTLFPLYSQVTVSGIVTNVDGKILPGANIILKGSILGTVSDQEGQFILDIPEKDYSRSDGELIITYIGYITKNIIIQKEKQFYLTLS